MNDWSKPTKQSMIAKTKVELRNHRMEAWITLYAPPQGEHYTKELLEEILRKHHVIYGIEEEKLNQLCEKPCFGKEVLIAQGLKEIDGKDGFFVYLFDTSVDTKPRILEDGTVDYYAMTKIVTVSEGEIVARYHKAVSGTDGIDVCGSIKRAKAAKDLKPLKVKGVKLSEDRFLYTALITGKIELSGENLTVSNLLEIKEDLDYLQGDIHFKGDLMIYGNITAGKVVEAEGSITVRGHVEGAVIRAGKNVILESGMQGAGKGSIVSGGSISGRFFEQVEMKAKENITANTIMNCSMEAGNEIIVTGKKGVLIGGTAYAGNKITASILGNYTYLRTELCVGIRDTSYKKHLHLEKQRKELKNRLVQVESAIAMITERETSDGVSPYRMEKLKLLRTKISISSEIADLMEEISTLAEFIKRSKHAKIVAQKMIYPGCHLTINGLMLLLKEEVVSSSFHRNGEVIEQIPLV